MPTVDEVKQTWAYCELFNGITRMHLIRDDGTMVLFSSRNRLAEHVVGLILEAGYMPEDMTPVFRTPERI